MLDTDMIWPEVFSQAPVVRFDAPASGGSVFIADDKTSVIVLSVPAEYDFTTNPTKDLFDRLSDLKSKYSVSYMPGGISPSECAFRDARKFVLTLPLTQMEKPKIHVASDGEVNFQWVGDDFRIDFGFYGNDKFSFYATKSGSEPILADEVPVKDGIPRALVDFASSA